MTITNESSLDELFQVCSSRLKNIFSFYLQDIPSLELKSAMEYALFNGGKHIRPLLIYATGLIFKAPLENLDIPASSVEIIHTYSLIHDDLPCMDNADLRRGKPTCHKAFGEGIAVLTGDALHTLAMQIISSHPASLKTDRRLQMMEVLSKACGPFGMAAGQTFDITVMNDGDISADLLDDIYKLKTGALFTACIELGRLASADDDEFNQQALQQFGDCIGFAFQIQDDILDIITSTESLGKPQGIDVKNNKITYPRLHGMQHAKDKVQQLYQEALEAINYLGDDAQLLRELTGYMLQRQK
ncbi:polyprenyl synthetase family protein [Aquicella lusitana]|uniref:Farnesyl-diphosphate synthase n=1 Tax=Aquicella lusitana TaxID=254246 RepID=A0A370GNC2_9COXI|nr:farnesyl diphosphate synthase [Aquicella lusitana]RDI45167.1 farnesyl-diphosphate synthase [Aquicella lusitana]VVC72763.1 Farnesyl diphosphate synthase [Aquicella lusitana]